MFSVSRLVSRRCHKISSILRLCPTPHRTVRARLRHTALQMSIDRSDAIPDEIDHDARSGKWMSLQHQIELLPVQSAPLAPAS